MKPLHLRLQAFGPYADVQIVDFRDAVDAGLFGIYGDTGAGKSTIFSGICFALFGESAQPDQRDAKTLRSDFSDAHTRTEVRFIFSLGLKQYHIVRLPAQARPKLKGDGVTHEGASASLFDVTGMCINDISTTNPGKVIVEKKVGTVNKEIVDILGYSAEQFRKIVLLPQGKFEAFLKANTSEKMKTLSELFDVTVYKQLTEQLVAKAKQASKSIDEDEIGLKARLEGDGYSSKEALEAGISEYEGQFRERDKAVKEALNTKESAENALKAAESVEAKFKEQADSQKALQAVEAKAPVMDEKARKLEAAKKAGTLASSENIVAERKKSLERSVGDLNAATNRVSETDKAAKDAATRFEKASEDAQATKGLVEEKALLVAALPRYREVDGYVSSLQNLDAQLASATATVKSGEAVLETLRASSEMLQKEKEAAVEREHRAELARNTLESTRAKLDVAEKYNSAAAGLKKARTEANEAERLERAAHTDLTDAESLFQDAESQLTEIQRIRLAEKLSVGEPCPVCGSSEHPHPATGSAEATGAGRAFEKAREDRNKAEEVHKDASKNLQACQTLVTERSKNLQQMVQPSGDVATLTSELRSVEARLKELAVGKTVEEIERAVAELGSKPQDAIHALKSAEEALGSLKESRAAAKASLQAAREGLPPNLKSHDECSLAISNIEKQVRALEGAREKARAEKEAADQAAEGAREAIRVAKKANGDAISSHKEAIEELEVAILELGFSNVEYQSARGDISAIETLEGILKTYHEGVAAARDREGRASHAIRDLERPKLDDLRVVLGSAVTKFEGMLEERGRSEQALKKLRALYSDVTGIIKRIETTRQEIAPILNISAACNGSNLKKITLETYALGVMFRQVLGAANQRLGPMSRGRYRFEHATEATGGTGKHGLDIEVFDIHTGKSRPPQTLSGGETFYAALSLALGLSEVVERSSGNVQLDTIFIDEGFGSLDASDDAGTLEEVLRSLSDRSGQARVVGLISHVQRVQEAIPNGFYVRGGNKGSTVEAQS